MKKFKYILLMLLLMLLSSLANDTASSLIGIPLSLALPFEIFNTIHMSLFVFLPLSKLLSNDSKKLFKQLFGYRALILLLFDLFITPSIALLDFAALFIGAFIVVPVVAIKKKKTPFNLVKESYISNSTNTEPVNNDYKFVNNTLLTCSNCHNIVQENEKFCFYCGANLINNTTSISNSETNFVVRPSDFDPIYSKTESILLEEFIKREVAKANLDIKSTMIPADALKRKNILSLIFAVLVFVYISLVFFHFPIYTYITGLIILFVFYKITKKYNLIKYLKKEVKSRPSEKISNIVMNTKNSLTTDSYKLSRIVCIIIAAILPLFIFFNPRIMYETIEGGYAVRFYTFGLSNYTTVKIPEKYKNKPVVSLRGNAFSNMPFLRKVELPDTITEIRGQAFKNDRNLVEVNIPNKLSYLGGGAFYNCTSLTSLELPDTLTYLGGEAFYNATSLESIKLSNNLTEIRGNTFENCSSLKSIVIPDNVTRIGGHAFYGNSSLAKVTITENSKLEEIGSSAFRLCNSLKTIRIPRKTSVNYRAFKQSPTIVERFSKNGLNYGELIDDTKYYNNRLLYINVGEKVPISYSNRTLVYKLNAYLKLDSISSKNNSNEFNIIYIDDNNQSISLTLTENVPFKEINQNVAVEMANENALDYSNKVYLKVYFN